MQKKGKNALLPPVKFHHSPTSRYPALDQRQHKQCDTRANHGSRTLRNPAKEPHCMLAY